uniref:General transcription and DNA repair factor IIH subunit TFB4 n=1 Tax=Leersia perrieri TaxID=77586 RepID=A0A0D9VBM7_9ORYZ
MASKLYSDDVSLAVVVVDTNPFFWAGAALPFSEFFAHLIHYVNSILLLNHLNHVVVIAAGLSSCTYIFDSSDAGASGAADVAATFGKASRRMDEFIEQDARATTSNGSVADGNAASLLSAQLLISANVQAVFATDLHSRTFLRLPKTLGVDFRASIAGTHIQAF